MRKNEKNINKKIPDIKFSHTGFHIEMDKGVFGTIISVHGVRAVIDVGKEEIIMKLNKGRIRVYGESLEIFVYENRIVEITGKIGGVEFI